jgi:predicted RNase H-like nuclease (RuvC/YqgF family)
MGFFKRLKFWKRKKNNAGTKVDACVSIEDQWNCDAYIVSMNPTVMCTANIQTETTMDDDAAAAKQYKLELDMKDRKIRELEEKTVRLEEENRKLSLLVEDSEREIVQLKEEMQRPFQDQTSHIHHIQTRYEEENYRQLVKIRDMRDELLWYKEKLPGLTGEYILYCIKQEIGLIDKQ